MNKEEILAKSVKENIYGDEREKKIRIHRDAFSACQLPLLFTKQLKQKGKYIL